jgi:hypothetical protein
MFSEKRRDSPRSLVFRSYDQITAADMFHAPWFGYRSRDVHDGRESFNRCSRANLFHVVDAVLQAEDEGAGSDQRSQRARRG